MAHSVMFSLFAFLVIAGVCDGHNWRHFVGQIENGDQVPMDLALTKEKMITKFESAIDEVNDIFRETTNLFVFKRKLVAIRDDVFNKCYVQQTDITHEEVLEMIRSLDTDKDDTAFEIEEEEIIINGLPNKISPEEVLIRFGEEISNHCLDHDVFYLDGEDRIRSQGGIALIKRAITIRIRVRIGPLRIVIRIRF